MEDRYAYPFAQQVIELVTAMASYASALAAMDCASIADRATDVCIRRCQDTGFPEIIKRM